MTTKKSQFALGDRVIAVSVISGKPEAFTIKSMRHGILVCSSVGHNFPNIEYKIRKNQVIGHSDL